MLSEIVGDHPASKPMSLLNLACGRADETGVLADVFGKKGIDITGMDIRDRELDMARERWGKLLPSKANAEFHVQNGTTLNNLKELQDDFDVVFMRHQNYWNGDTTWQQIYDQALHRLDQDGRLVITSYFDREHHLALEAIQSLGAELVTDIRNENSRTLSDAPGKSVDRHIAVFRKP
jgi:SAM-dependent methyltransferase